MRTVQRLALAGAAVVSMVAGGGAAAVAAPAAAPAACTLTMGNVGYSAGMFYVSGWLSGDCRGQVTMDLQLSETASGPFTTVETTVTYPLNPDAQGGTAWFTDAYNIYGCGFYYRGVGTYGDLTGVSPRPQHPC